ncbi:hypothetical protein [Alicyclobacillus sendaiensis]|uniref:hypothetical protein n=1 Tax=Alicyclobacillus sendaiensis TaxID=192387 RepID=UPI001FE0C1BF|nr:hypothetical protein [Alicyclobacillus sendaiensis]
MIQVIMAYANCQSVTYFSCIKFRNIRKNADRSKVGGRTRPQRTCEHRGSGANDVPHVEDDLCGRGLHLENGAADGARSAKKRDARCVVHEHRSFVQA